MNESKHTPGPWTGGNSRVWGAAFEICEVKNGMGTPTACANARLIVAAPDLIDELVGVLRCFDRDNIPVNQEERASGAGIRVFITYRHANRLRDIINKARGIE